MLPALPQVHSWDDAIAHSDLAYRHPGRRVLIEGVYEIDPIPTAQGARFVWIRMADGSGVLRAEDVVASEIGFAGTRVHATGELYRVGLTRNEDEVKTCGWQVTRHVLRLMGGAVFGEGSSSAKAIPVAPIVRSGGVLQERLMRWSALVGTLQPIGGSGAAVCLVDGTIVTVPPRDDAEWTVPVGSAITVTGRTRFRNGDFEVFGRIAMCPGVVPRCGM